MNTIYYTYNIIYKYPTTNTATATTNNNRLYIIVITLEILRFHVADEKRFKARVISFDD